MSEKIIEVSFNWETRCPFCEKRKVTRSCDMPLGEVRYVGHPPKGFGPMRDLVLCRREMCDECAYPVDGEIDLCPDCALRVKLTRKGRKKTENTE